MILAEDPSMVNLFKKRLTGDPALDTAAKLMTRKLEIQKQVQVLRSKLSNRLIRL